MTTVKHFFAKDCEVCGEMKPEIKKFGKSHKNLKVQMIDVDTAAGSRLADQNKINSIPATVLKDSQCSKKVIGFVSSGELTDIMNRSCESF